MTAIDWTADELETFFRIALKTGDAKGVEAALTLMCSVDARRAVELYDDLKTGIAIVSMLRVER